MKEDGEGEFRVNGGCRETWWGAEEGGGRRERGAIPQP